MIASVWSHKKNVLNQRLFDLWILVYSHPTQFSTDMMHNVIHESGLYLGFDSSVLLISAE
jgi:hypothetical protein